jgi:hypothetical protein
VGFRGPLPKSPVERQYEGEAAHRPLPSARAAVRFGIPERPKGMLAAARRFWTFYVEQMLLQGTLRPIDGPCLEMICNLHADLKQLEREKRKLIRQNKAAAKTENRVMQGGALLEFEVSTAGRRLQATIASKSSALKQLCDRYGLNPMSGGRLQTLDNSVPMPQHSQAHEPASELEQRIQ